MAIYHVEAKVITRSVGRSACAAAAYMSCSVIENDYDGVRHDYTRKQGLMWQRIMLPEHAPQKWQDRSALWNAVEKSEKAKDSRLAREFVLALPIELEQKEQIAMLTQFVQNHFVAEGMCADVCIHDTDGHNPHAHVLLTVRPLNDNGTWQHKTEKEYLCMKNGEERGFTATEYMRAKDDGWEKQYRYRVGREKKYLAPTQVEDRGYERLSKYPKSTQYGRQNPIAERWNSESQLIAWRAAWADAVNQSLDHLDSAQRVDHRSHVERGMDEQPTVHEGVAAHAMERKGIMSDRCELNRQIKSDNALLRALKAALKSLLKVFSKKVEMTLPAMAEAMESLREKLLVLRYQVLHIQRGKKHFNDTLDILERKREVYKKYVADIKKASKAQKALLEEKGKVSPLNLPKHAALKQQIAEEAKRLEELRSNKQRLLQSMGYPDTATADHFQMGIAENKGKLHVLGQQEEKCNAEMDTSMQEYAKLQKQAERFDPVALYGARKELRPDKERNALARIESTCVGKVSVLMWNASQKDTSLVLEDEQKMRVAETRKKFWGLRKEDER